MKQPGGGEEPPRQTGRERGSLTDAEAERQVGRRKRLTRGYTHTHGESFLHPVGDLHVSAAVKNTGNIKINKFYIYKT